MGERDWGVRGNVSRKISNLIQYWSHSLTTQTHTSHTHTSHTCTYKSSPPHIPNTNQTEGIFFSHFLPSFLFSINSIPQIYFLSCLVKMNWCFQVEMNADLLQCKASSNLSGLVYREWLKALHEVYKLDGSPKLMLWKFNQWAKK